MTNTLKHTIASVLLASGTALGVAAPASAQNSITSVTTTDDGESKGFSIRQIGGVEYKIEFEGETVTRATIDGLEVDFTNKDGVVTIEDGDDTVVINMPSTRTTFGVDMDARFPGVVTWNNDRAMFDHPKTMVGLTQRNLDDQLREHLGLEEGVGTVIMSVVEGLPADKAGLKAGDVLIEVDGEKVDGTGVLTKALAEIDPGDELPVVLLRKGLPESLTITVAAYDREKMRFDTDFFFGNGPGAALAPRFPGAFVDGNLDEVRKQLKESLSKIEALDEKELARVMELVEKANKQAQRATGLRGLARIGGEGGQLRFEGDRDWIVQGGDDDEPVIIEQRLRSERQRENERQGVELRQRNQELEERLKALESRLDRLLEALEEKDE